MSKDPSKPKTAPAPKPAPANDSIRVTNNNTGRVTFDDRGNAVWEWSVATGEFGTEVSTSRLQKLENSSLSLADEVPAADPLKSTLAKPNPKGVAQGYSPYESGLLVKPPAQGPGAPRKKDLKRLGEWLQQRKQSGHFKPEQ